MSFHPTHEALFILYEVIDSEGVTTHEGESASEAVAAFRSAPAGARLLMSGWDTPGEEAILVGQPLDATALIGAVRGGWVW